MYQSTNSAVIKKIILNSTKSELINIGIELKEILLNIELNQVNWNYRMKIFNLYKFARIVYKNKYS